MPGYPDYPYGPQPHSYGPPAPPPPGYPAPGYPQPYPPPGYQAPPTYGWQTGYPPPPGYGSPPPSPRPWWAPGVIPLRPLSLSDIFNGAALYIRANPRATLGWAAIVVVITQLISLAASVGPLAAATRLQTAPAEQFNGGDVGALVASAGLSGLVGWLGDVLLTGMLAVVVGRAVFGGTIGAGEAWSRVRGRFLPLLGLVTLEAVGMILLAGGVGTIIGATAAAGNVPAAILLGFPLVLTSVAVVVYLYVALSFAPVLVVLERLPVFDAMTRSFGLVHNSFWRILGIRMLAWLVVSLIAGAVAVPFAFLGHVVAGSSVLGAATVGAVGTVIGRVITTPFDAGVVVLLYIDRRIRSEAFDLVLRSGAPAHPASTDYLWLTRPV